TPARSSTALMTVAPSSWAATLAKAPLKEPTGVRAALAITMDELLMDASSNIYIVAKETGKALGRSQTGRTLPISFFGCIDLRFVKCECRIAQRDCHHARFALTLDLGRAKIRKNNGVRRRTWPKPTARSS